MDFCKGMRRVGIGRFIPAGAGRCVAITRGRWKVWCIIVGGEDDAIFAEVVEEGGGKRYYARFEGGGSVSWVRLVCILKLRIEMNLLGMPVVIRAM